MQIETPIGELTLPTSVRERIADGSIGRVMVIGQGTAAAAGASLALALGDQAVADYAHNHQLSLEEARRQLREISELARRRQKAERARKK